MSGVLLSEPTQRGADIPFAEYEALHGNLEEMARELAATRTALTREHNANRRLQKKLEEIRELNADDDAAKNIPNAETILTFLGWWRDQTGRPANTRIDLTTVRAALVRKALHKRSCPADCAAHWSPQELCWMVKGILRDEWYVQHEKTDIKHLLKDESIAERFLKMGRPVRENGC